MVPLILILTVAAFILADFLVRLTLKRKDELRRRREREEALQTRLQLNFADEAKSLKRVDVKDPKARILAVDDEDVVLDSLRRILVLEGYSVDTVESGPEALTLLKNTAYDFLFTDLKMPLMDGVEVTKAAKHIRPDVDVVIITGYATVESAVETMKVGALDYVQKPFTPEELTDKVNNFLIRRNDRVSRLTRPVLHVLDEQALPAESAARQLNMLPGLFVSSAHVWVALSPGGSVRLGLDDFVQKLIGPFDTIEPFAPGSAVQRGQPLLTLIKQNIRLLIPSPFSGRIVAVNEAATANPSIAAVEPFQAGWLYTAETADLSKDIHALRLGDDAISWYKQEIERYSQLVEELRRQGAEPIPEPDRLQRFASHFLK